MMSKKVFIFLITTSLLFFRAILSSKVIMSKRLPFNPELSMTAAEIIRHRGYPVESHSVTTEDGYILELRRIPPRLNNKKAKPVFLMYGYLGSDAMWSMMPANRSLAYLLADKGYDVWMGNSRGNTYSRKHVTLNPKESQYWDHSWDEMGRFDVPASLLYVLKTTEQEKLSYIGNSFGCTLFFIAMASRPELNKHIDVMMAMAPVSTFDSRNYVTHLLAPIWPLLKIGLEKLLKFNNLGDFIVSPFLRRTQHLLCERTYRSAAFCRDVMSLALGFNRKNFDLTSMPVLATFIPDGMSVKTITHAIQHNNRVKSLSAFDFGRRENKKRYGSPKPPPYDLSLVTAPVYLFWGENDQIASPKDVAWLGSKLGNLRGSIRVPDPKFNHFDPMIGLNVYQVLYSTIMSLLPELA